MYFVQNLNNMADAVLPFEYLLSIFYELLFSIKYFKIINYWILSYYIEGPYTFILKVFRYLTAVTPLHKTLCLYFIVSKISF